MTLLAEVYDNGATRLTAPEIATRRKLQPAFLSKVLTTLAQAGLVDGSRGPGGGFTLLHPPEEIRLYQIFRLFEREEVRNACPFGNGMCGVGKKCPLHDRFMSVRETMDEILRNTTLEAFRHG